MNPLVSVIIPAYNAETFLELTLQSVFSQSFQNWELILINDGSTDRTGEVVAKFTDPRIQYICQKNLGLGEARNTGIRNAQGKFIALLDSDDLWDKKYLEKMVSEIIHHPDAAAIYCGFQYINNDSIPVGNSNLRVVPSEIFHKTLIQEGNWLVPSAVILRKHLVEEVGYFDGSLWGVEDTDLWIRLSRNHNFIGISEILVKYRVHEGNMSKNPEHMVTGASRMFEKQFGPLPENVSTWSETKKTALVKLYIYGTKSYFAAGNISRSADYFWKSTEYTPNTILDIAFFRSLIRMHLPVYSRYDANASLNWEIAQKNIELFLNELEGKRSPIKNQLAKIKAGAYLAMADEAGRDRKLRKVYKWLLTAVQNYPSIVFIRSFWGTLYRSISKSIFGSKNIIRKGEFI